MSKRTMTRAAALIVVAILVVATFQVVGAGDDTQAEPQATSTMTLYNTAMYIVANDAYYAVRGESTGSGGEGLRGAQYNYGEAVRGYGSSVSYAGYFAGRTGVYGYSGTSNYDSVYGYAPSGYSSIWAGRFENDSTSGSARAGYFDSYYYTSLKALVGSYSGYFDVLASGPYGIYSAGGYWSKSGTGVIVFNAGDVSLDKGDLVAVAGVHTMADGSPALAVRKAARGDAVIGVVSSKFVVETGVETREKTLWAATTEDEVAPNQTTAMKEYALDDHMGDGPAAPGEFASVVISGLAQAKVAQLDVARVTSGSAAISRSGSTFGFVADANAVDGLVWVFVSPR